VYLDPAQVRRVPRADHGDAKRPHRSLRRSSAISAGGRVSSAASLL
jgi:hypothetical protein